MQVIIDSCKREYEIDGMEEIKRIQRLPCMTKMYEEVQQDEDGNNVIVKIKKDFPIFMKYTRTINFFKDGKERKYEDIKKDKDRLAQRINEHLECPMNWLQEWLDKIQCASSRDTIPTRDFFIKMNGSANSRHISKIMDAIIQYDNNCQTIKAAGLDDDLYALEMKKQLDIVLDALSKVKSKHPYTINRLIELALGIEKAWGGVKSKKYNFKKYSRKILNLLYRVDKDKFLSNFIGDFDTMD